MCARNQTMRSRALALPLWGLRCLLTVLFWLGPAGIASAQAPAACDVEADHPNAVMLERSSRGWVYEFSGPSLLLAVERRLPIGLSAGLGGNFCWDPYSSSLVLSPSVSTRVIGWGAHGLVVQLALGWEVTWLEGTSFSDPIYQESVTYHTFLLHAGLWYEHRGLPFVRLGVMPFATLHQAYTPTRDIDIWDQLSPAFALGSLF